MKYQIKAYFNLLSLRIFYASIISFSAMPTLSSPIDGHPDKGESISDVSEGGCNNRYTSILMPPRMIMTHTLEVRLLTFVLYARSKIGVNISNNKAGRIEV